MEFVVVDLEATCWDGPRQAPSEIIEIGAATPLASWGNYDYNQFRQDCDLHGVRSCGMDKALRHLGLRLTGAHHRGIDDARNICEILLRMRAAGWTP